MCPARSMSRRMPPLPLPGGKATPTAGGVVRGRDHSAAFCSGDQPLGHGLLKKAALPQQYAPAHPKRLRFAVFTFP